MDFDDVIICNNGKSSINASHFSGFTRFETNKQLFYKPMADPAPYTACTALRVWCMPHKKDMYVEANGCTCTYVLHTTPYVLLLDKPLYNDLLITHVRKVLQRCMLFLHVLYHTPRSHSPSPPWPVCSPRRLLPARDRIPYSKYMYVQGSQSQSEATTAMMLCVHVHTYIQHTLASVPRIKGTYMYNVNRHCMFYFTV